MGCRPSEKPPRTGRQVMAKYKSFGYAFEEIAKPPYDAYAAGLPGTWREW